MTENILEQKVLLELSGLPSDGNGQAEGIELMCPGEYHFVNGKHYISYEETTDEKGQKPDTRCLLKISKKNVELVKRGDVTTHMFFEPGSPNLTVYNTPFGQFDIETNVTSLRVLEEPHLLLVEMVYTLNMNYDFAQECHLTIKVTD